MPLKIKVDTSEIDKLLLDVLFQACEHNGIIDNRCISSYEDACDYLTSKGILRTINGRCYEIVKKQPTVNKAFAYNGE